MGGLKVPTLWPVQNGTGWKGLWGDPWGSARVTMSQWCSPAGSHVPGCVPGQQHADGNALFLLWLLWGCSMRGEVRRWEHGERGGSVRSRLVQHGKGWLMDSCCLGSCRQGQALLRAAGWKEGLWGWIPVRDSDFHSACGKALEQGAWRGGAVSTLQESQNSIGFLPCLLVSSSEVFNRLTFAACGTQQCRAAPHLSGQSLPSSLGQLGLERGRRFQKLKQPVSVSLFKREKKPAAFTSCIEGMMYGWMNWWNRVTGRGWSTRTDPCKAGSSRPVP